MTAGPAPLALRSRSFRSDRIAWAVSIALVVLAIVGVRGWLHRRVRADALPDGATTAFRLPVLAWDRVGPRPDGVPLDARRIAEQLDAVEAAGFTPVSLHQVRDAYLAGAPLPPRPILLTFDGGHLSTYEAVDPILRRKRWPAVMFLDPRPVDDRNATHVYWDRLRRMVDSGIWEVGALGVDPGGVARLREALGQPVLAVLSSPAARAAADVAPLAFESSLFGVNDPSASPGRLLRVHVPAAWTGGALVERLAFSLDAPATRTCPDGAPPVPTARWIPGVGRLEADGGVVTVTGLPRGEAWLAGGEWARDFVLEVDVRAERGSLWIVQQAVGDRDQWRWGTSRGVAYLQRLRPGEPAEVVSRVPLDARDRAWHRVRLVKRGSGVWVEWDGAPVAEMPRALGARARGQIAIATGSPSEPGRVAIRNARFAAIPYRIRPVSASPAKAEIEALLRDVPCLAAISPPGVVAAGPALRRPEVDRALLAMLAAKGAWDVVPGVELSGGAATDPRGAAEVAELAARERWAGVRLVAPRASAAPGHRPPRDALRDALGRRGVPVYQDEEAPR